MPQPILVVEDSEDLSLLMKLTLESEGYEVSTVNSGRDALSTLEKIQPQLILMDIMMPDLNGLQVAQAIRKHFDPESLPILLVSAIDRLKSEHLAASGADDIIYKPFDLNELLLRVSELISQAR